MQGPARSQFKGPDLNGKLLKCSGTDNLTFFSKRQFKLCMKLSYPEFGNK